MALKTYASQAEVPEALRSDYVEKDGKWVPEIDGAEDVSGLKRNHAELKLDAQRLRDKLKAFDGMDPEKAKAALDAQAKAEEDKQKQAGNWDQLKAQMVQQHTQALDAVRGDLKKRDAFIERLLIENEARKHLEGPAVSVDGMLPHVVSQIRVKAVGDGWTSVVVNADGVERVKADGTAFSVGDLVKEMSGEEKWAFGFKGTQANGSGGRGSGNQSGNVKTIPAGDPTAFLANLEGIAKGTVTVGA